MSYEEISNRICCLERKLLEIIELTKENDVLARSTTKLVNISLPASGTLYCQGGVYNVGDTTIILKAGMTIPKSLTVLTTDGVPLTEVDGGAIYIGSLIIINNKGTLTVTGSGNYTLLPGQSADSCSLPCNTGIITNNTSTTQPLTLQSLGLNGHLVFTTLVSPDVYNNQGYLTFVFNVDGNTAYVFYDIATQDYTLEYTSGVITLPPYSFVCATSVCYYTDKHIGFNIHFTGLVISPSTTPNTLQAAESKQIPYSFPIISPNNSSMFNVLSANGVKIYFFVNDSNGDPLYITQDGSKATIPIPVSNFIALCGTTDCNSKSITNTSSNDLTLGKTTNPTIFPTSLIFTGFIQQAVTGDTFTYNGVTIIVTYNSTNLTYSYTTNGNVTIPGSTSICYQSHNARA